MEFRIVHLPPFRAASSGVDKEIDFSDAGILGKFNAYFSGIRPEARDDFMPRDFLFFDDQEGGLVWWWALSEGMDDGGYGIADFDGGSYLTYTFRDGDEETNGIRYREALKYIENSGIFEFDARPGHYAMGHIITPREIIDAQGWSQMEVFMPIKLKQGVGEQNGATAPSAQEERI
ncbi:MAG TPA: hypothetical protein VN540_10505 [Clostridia bacterium]|nr:hypothetical protein [Clostridia bacterium]